MQEKTCLTSEMDAQSLSKRCEPITRSSEVVEASVAPSVAISGVGLTGSGRAVEAESRQDQAEPCNSALPSTLGGGHGTAGEPQTGVGCTRHETPAARYRFDNENGKHCHLLDGKPLIGTSTICSEGLPKHGLVWWAAERAAVECLEWAAGMSVQPTSLEALLYIREEVAALKGLTGYAKTKARNAIQKKYPIFKKARFAHREAKETAAGPGTDMHKALEDYVKHCVYNLAGEPFLDGRGSVPAVYQFAQWAVANVREFLWSEGHCYSERLWTGGICDVGMILKDGSLAVGDFKSSDEAYFSQLVQVAGYALQIQENGLFDAGGKAISHGITHTPSKAIIVFPFGGNGEPTVRYDVADWKNTFEAAVTIHKHQTKYERN